MDNPVDSEYLDTLKNTYIDKAFFVEKLPKDVDVIIDYGCADGSFLNFLRNIYGDRFKYYGVEKIKNFRELCQVKNNIQAFENIKQIKVDYKKVCLNFSSSLHEIFMSNDPKTFFTNLCKFKTGFPKIISIRDMYVVDRHDIEYKQFILHCIYCFVKKCPVRFSEFLNNPSCRYISDTRQCMHFLLKYMYNVNWEKENQEDYLSFTKNFQSLENFTNCYYNKIWEFEYNLPYLIRKWKEDEMIDDEIETYIKNYITTHVQLLYECK